MPKDFQKEPFSNTPVEYVLQEGTGNFEIQLNEESAKGFIFDLLSLTTPEPSNQEIEEFIETIDFRIGTPREGSFTSDKILGKFFGPIPALGSYSYGGGKRVISVYPDAVSSFGHKAPLLYKYIERVCGFNESHGRRRYPNFEQLSSEEQSMIIARGCEQTFVHEALHCFDEFLGIQFRKEKGVSKNYSLAKTDKTEVAKRMVSAVLKSGSIPILVGYSAYFVELAEALSLVNIQDLHPKLPTMATLGTVSIIFGLKNIINGVLFSPAEKWVTSKWDLGNAVYDERQNLLNSKVFTVKKV